MDPLSAIFVMAVLGGLFVKGVDVATDGLLSAEVGAGVRGAAGYAVRAERARWGRARAKAREIRTRTPQGQAVQEFLDLAGLFGRTLFGEFRRFGSGARSGWQTARDQARSARTERRGEEPLPVVRAARSGAVRVREWAERARRSGAGVPNVAEQGDPNGPNGETRTRFFHASPAELKPGQVLSPARDLPPDASPHARWYAEGGSAAAWRAGRVWVWPTLAHAVKWAAGGEGEQVYEVEAVDPQPLTECGHGPTSRLLRSCDCYRYGQQWHAASATVVRLVPSGTNDPNGAPSGTEPEPNATTEADPSEGCLHVTAWVITPTTTAGPGYREPRYCGEPRESGWVLCPTHIAAKRADPDYPQDDIAEYRADPDRPGPDAYRSGPDPNGDPIVPLESTVPNQNGDVRCGCCAQLHKPLAPGEHCPNCHIHDLAPNGTTPNAPTTRGPSMDINSAPAAIAAAETLRNRFEEPESLLASLHQDAVSTLEGMGDFGTGDETDTADRFQLVIDALGSAREAWDVYVAALHEEWDEHIAAAEGRTAGAHAPFQEV